ncbi:NnrS family protein [Rhizobacter sp. P5_C2]
MGGPADRPSQKWLLIAPHRLCFFVAGIAMACIALWWLLVLVDLHAGARLPWTLTPALAHGLVMSDGFMPLFIAGFLFTAGIRWMGVAAVDARRLQWPVGLIAAGIAITLAGFRSSTTRTAIGWPSGRGSCRCCSPASAGCAWRCCWGPSLIAAALPGLARWPRSTR